MKKHDSKQTQPVRIAPAPDLTLIPSLMAQAWKPESSSLKREEWRQIVMETLG